MSCDNIRYTFMPVKNSLYYKNKNSDNPKAVITVKEKTTNICVQCCIDSLGNVQFKCADEWINFDILKALLTYDADGCIERIYETIGYANEVPVDKLFNEIADYFNEELLRDDSYTCYEKCIERVKELIEKAHADYHVEYCPTSEYYNQVASKLFELKSVSTGRLSRQLALAISENMIVYKVNALQRIFLEKLND